MTRALEAIVFDFDGVIADSERLHLAAYQRVLAPLGLELSDEAYYARYLGYDDVGCFDGMRATASWPGTTASSARCAPRRAPASRSWRRAAR
jgi:beta-phosphoglucomutase-like phosphatase (HAD superfamily)